MHLAGPAARVRRPVARRSMFMYTHTSQGWRPCSTTSPFYRLESSREARPSPTATGLLSEPVRTGSLSALLTAPQTFCIHAPARPSQPAPPPGATPRTRLVQQLLGEEPEVRGSRGLPGSPVPGAADLMPISNRSPGSRPSSHFFKARHPSVTPSLHTTPEGGSQDPTLQGSPRPAQPSSGPPQHEASLLRSRPAVSCSPPPHSGPGRPGAPRTPGCRTRSGAVVSPGTGGAAR